MQSRKFFAGLLLLFCSSIPLRAQWEQDPWVGNSGMQSGLQFTASKECTSINVIVKNSDGRSIIGAALVMEDTGYPATTDAHGLASFPGCIAGKIPPKVMVTATGYKSTQLSLVPGIHSYYEVTLEEKQAIVRSTSSTVNAAELSSSAQETAAALQNQGMKAFSRRDYEAAEKLFLEAWQLTPSSPALANYLGTIALHKKDIPCAESWFQKATILAPFQPAFLANLGYVRWLQNRPEESYELLSDACAKGYESAVAHFILGAVGLTKGRNQESIFHLTKISANEFPYRDLYLSMAFRNTGNTKAADQSYRKFLKRNPEPEQNSLLLP